MTDGRSGRETSRRRATPAAALAVAIALGACGQAASPTLSLSGGPASSSRAASSSASPTLDPTTQRGLRLMRDLGLEVAQATTSIAPDPVTGRAMATTSGYDPSGARVADLQVDLETGSVRSVVCFGQPDPTATPPPLTAAEVTAAARAFLDRVGLTEPVDPPSVSWDEGLAAWLADWPRTLAGLPVPSDGTSVWLLGVDRFKGLRHLETAAAATPTTRITAEAATRAARAFLARSPARGALITDVTLRWDLPNDALAALPSGISADQVRLVYAVSYRVPQADGSDLEGALLVDAGSGQLVGALDVS